MMANTSTNDGSPPHEQVSEAIAARVMEKGHREGAAFINDECVNGISDNLNYVLDVILNPEKNIDNLDNIEWCKWLIAGGRTPDEFASIGKVNDIINIIISSARSVRVCIVTRSCLYARCADTVHTYVRWLFAQSRVYKCQSTNVNMYFYTHFFRFCH